MSFKIVLKSAHPAPKWETTDEPHEDDYEYIAKSDHDLCDYCGKMGGLVYAMIDPFLLEIHDETEYAWFHLRCVDERWLDT